MQLKNLLQKPLTWLLAAGATLSVGFLAFVGMFAFSSSLIWCGVVFLLAAAYEGQVNLEGISDALRRMFDPDYMKNAVIDHFLTEQAENDLTSQLENNKEYIDQKELCALHDKIKNPTPNEKIHKQVLYLHLKEIEHTVKVIKNIKNTFSRDYQKQKKYVAALDEIEHPTAEEKAKREQAKQVLRHMQHLFLNQLTAPHTHTALQKSMEALIDTNRAKVLSEITRKKRIIQGSWLFALGLGTWWGLATLNAVQASVATFSVLSFVPGGVFAGIAAFVAVSYTMLVYQTISDMVEKYHGKVFDNLKRREGESTPSHVLRCIGVAAAVLLAITSTIATAGGSWYAVKNASSIFQFGQRLLNSLLTAALVMMVIPSVIFAAKNSVESIDKISKSHYRQLAYNLITDIKTAWHKQKSLFFNPFYLAGRLVAATKKLFFLGHIASMSVIATSEQLESVPPLACAIPNGVSELLVDANYLNPEHNHSSEGALKSQHEDHHNHESKLTQAMFFPITVASTLLKICAVGWDRLFSNSFSQSWQNIFGKSFTASCRSMLGLHTHEKSNIEKPILSEEWTHHTNQEKHQTAMNPSLKQIIKKPDLFPLQENNEEPQKNAPLSPKAWRNAVNLEKHQIKMSSSLREIERHPTRVAMAHCLNTMWAENKPHGDRIESPEENKKEPSMSQYAMSQCKIS